MLSLHLAVTCSPAVLDKISCLEVGDSRTVRDDLDQLHCPLILQANLPGPKVDGSAQGGHGGRRLGHIVRLELRQWEVAGYELPLFAPLYLPRVFAVVEAHAWHLGRLRLDHRLQISFVKMVLLRRQDGRDFLVALGDGSSQGGE